jgi:hypothetical protein
MTPLLQGAWEWCPPVRAADIFGSTHFAARCAERGVRSVPGYLLLWVVKEALDRGRDDLVAPVYAICEESTLYRILLPEGAFFPVIRGGVPVTIYTAKEKQNLRRTRRMRRRHTGSRVRKAVAR